MEAATNLANAATKAASKAIFGESTAAGTENQAPETPMEKREPLSGETGDVAAGEPYDMGNVEGATGSAAEGAIGSSTKFAETKTTAITSKDEVPDTIAVTTKDEIDEATAGVKAATLADSSTSSGPKVTPPSEQDIANAKGPEEKQTG